MKHKRAHPTIVLRFHGWNRAAWKRLLEANGGDFGWNWTRDGRSRTKGPLFNALVLCPEGTVLSRNGEKMGFYAPNEYIFWIKADAAWLVILDWLLAHWPVP